MILRRTFFTACRDGAYTALAMSLVPGTLAYLTVSMGWAWLRDVALAVKSKRPQ